MVDLLGQLEKTDFQLKFSWRRFIEFYKTSWKRKRNDVVSLFFFFFFWLLLLLLLLLCVYVWRKNHQDSIFTIYICFLLLEIVDKWLNSSFNISLIFWNKFVLYHGIITSNLEYKLYKFVLYHGIITSNLEYKLYFHSTWLLPI